jgi:hypothetical protein
MGIHSPKLSNVQKISYIYNTTTTSYTNNNSYTFSPSCSHKRIPQTPTGEEEGAEEEVVVVEEVEVDEEEG